MGVETKVGLGCAPSDQGGVVQFGGERDGSEHADHAKPLATQPDPGSGQVGRELLGGPGAEDDSREGRGRPVEPAALGNATADRVQQSRLGGQYRDGAGVAHVDVVIAVDRGVDAPGRGHRVHRGNPGRHLDRFGRELRPFPQYGLAGCGDEQVGAERVQSPVQIGAAG